MEGNEKVLNEVLARVCAIQTEVADLHRRMNNQEKEETKNDVKDIYAYMKDIQGEMSDIRERINEVAEYWGIYTVPKKKRNREMDEMRAEVIHSVMTPEEKARLEEVKTDNLFKKVSDLISDVSVIKALKDKVWKPKFEEHDKEIEELKNENKKLRAAIEVISKYIASDEINRALK